MSSLVIPRSGFAIAGPPKPSSTTKAIGLSLPDAVIEEMIKCVQNGSHIQLSLGNNPSISYGTKLQHLGPPSTDSCTQEVFRTSSQSKVQPSSKFSIPHLPPNSFSGPMINSALIATIDQKFAPSDSPEHLPQTQTSSGNCKKSKKVGADAALAALQSSLATESMKKAENTVKYIKDGSLSIPGKRGAGKSSHKPSLLAQTRQGNDSGKCIPVSSPKLASIPLSQQQAEQAKAARKPVIHLLAATPLTEAALQSKVPGSRPQDLKQALLKVGDLNETTQKWELRKAFYKELDVWNFKYEQQADRQRAIDNAVKIFDKMRLNVSEPQWEKLLSRSERWTGKCLSKLQAQIAQASNQKAPKATELGRDSPFNGNDDGTVDKVAAKIKGESMVRSTSQGSTKSKKALSEKEAQTKRLLSKKPPNSKQTTTKPSTKSTIKKAVAPKKSQPKNTKSEVRVISSEYVQSSDDEDMPTVGSKAPEKGKRPRENDELETNSQNMPVSKKLKKGLPKNQRASDASQTSRTTSANLPSTFAGKSVKTNSPRKSSPLASSPTNASDFDQSVASQTSTSTSASPPHPDVVSQQPPTKRQKTLSAPSRRLRPEVTDLARKYKMFYPKYLELHQRLTGMGNQRDRELERDLLEMHARLAGMKKQILNGIVDLDGG